MFIPEFLVSVLILAQQTLFRLRCVPFLLAKEEIVNCVERGFLDLSLNPRTDALTQYESKMFLLTMFSRSSYISRMLGVCAHAAGDPSGGVVSVGDIDIQTIITENGGFGTTSRSVQFSTFQRNQMSALTLLRQGFIVPTVAKYRLHVDAVKYRACLNPQRKQLIHERALAMGVDDPLRADYSQFLGRNFVVGGHLIYFADDLWWP
jgi:hypothetical protein